MDVGSQDKALHFTTANTHFFDVHTGSKCHKAALTLKIGNDIAKCFGGACATPTALSGERHPNSAASSTDQMQAPVAAVCAQQVHDTNDIMASTDDHSEEMRSAKVHAERSWKD